MAADQQQFLQLVESLMSGENDIRNLAETTYDGIPAETKIPYLMENIRNANVNVEVRQMAALLMRRLFTSTFEEFHPKLAPDIQIALREQLLFAIQQQEVVHSLRKKICDAVAELARNLIDDNGVNQWPEILKFLFECASSNDPSLKESALHIFTCVPGIFGNQQTQYLDVIKQMLYQCLQDDLLQVRFAAVKAIVAFLLAHEKDFPIQKHFVDCLSGILQAVTDSLKTQEDDAILKCLIDLAESCPRFLRHQIENIINLCMKCLGDTTLEDTWRHLALEVVVTISETGPAMVRKYSKFIPLLIPQILTLMVQLDEDQNWAISDEVTDDDSDSNAIAGESALDRIACGLGGKTVLPFIISNIPQMLSSPDWKYRHAALMAISAVGEGCHKQMEGILPQIMDGVLPFLQDSHPRVRYAACNAIGQMATDFAPNFEKKFHEKVVPGLLMVMDDNDNPRVQAHAGAALVNFSEDCPKNLLTQYLDAIMAKLEMILNHKFKELVEKGTKLVLEQVVTTIASVADTAEEKFINYYDRFMPCLKYIVQNANGLELRLLRGKTIECISLIGLAVGREKFMQDASEVMELLLKAQINQQEMEEDDPQISYMIAAWARMCKILGKQFEQYLPVVMGPVMKTASLKPEVALLDSEDMKAVSEDDDWQFVSLGDQQQNFGIKTAGLEDKATACRMLACYARELKGGFVEYSEQVVKLMVPMLKFYFHDGVRMAAAESLPYLLECAKIKGDGYVTDMWNYINPELLKAIDIEPENDVLSEHMTALAQCIETLGKGCLKEQQLIELFRILDKTLKEHFVRAAERQEKRKDEDYDEVVEETLMDEDDEDVFTLSKVSDVLHALFSTYKEDIFPYFDQLLPHVVRLLGTDRSWSDHQWGLCVFDDVLEHGGIMSVKYQQYFLPQMLDFLNDKSPEVRQAAAYGVGVMGQYAGKPFAHVCAEAIPSLLNMVNKPDSRSPENVNATENAIASVTKVLKYNHSCVNVDEILAHWLTWLPVWEDEAEAPHVYGYLCDLIESNHPVILGLNNSNLPRILSIMAEAFVKEAVDEEADITKRMVNIVRQIQSNSDVFTACLSQLSLEQQQALHNVLTTH